MADNPFASINEAEQHYDKVITPALFLTLQCCGITDVQADHAASHLGRAQGLATLVRGIPYFAKQQKCLLPIELCLHVRDILGDFIVCMQCKHAFLPRCLGGL